MRDEVLATGAVRHRGRCGRCAMLLLMVLTVSSLLTATFATSASAETGGASDKPAQTTIADLVGADAAYDGKEVVFTGEAIGSSYKGDDDAHRWVNLTDGDGNTIGVFMDIEDAAKVSVYGRYSVRGSMMTVTGVYHTACEEGHAGELDVHATKVAETTPGGPEETSPVTNWQWIGALAALVCGLVLLLADRALKHWRA